MTAVLEETIEFEPETDDEELPDEITARELERISLSAADWTTETIISQLERGNIDLSPRFQRRDAWKRDRKSRFIESLILNLPVPQIVLAERRESRGRFIVLDGKQRLTALLKFAGKAAEGEDLNMFSLTGLEVLTRLNGRTYADLENDPSLVGDLDALHNQTIRTVVIRNWENYALLHLVFVRLNTSSVPLSPQELRQALFPGDFVNYLDDRAYNSDVLKKFMGLRHADFRMRDVEILLRYLGFHFFIGEYSGNMSKFLNETTERLNARFTQDRASIEKVADDFETALKASIQIFGANGVARTWTGDRYETRWNRAILDVLLFYFSDAAIRDEAMNKEDLVVSVYKRLFTEDQVFRQATAATTKSLVATYQRFSLWGEALAAVLEVPVNVPLWNMRTNRIEYPGFPA